MSGNKDSKEFDKIWQKFLNYYNNITDDFLEKIIYSLNFITEVFVTNLQGENIYISFNGGKDCLCCYILIKYYFFCQSKQLDYKHKNSYIIFTKEGRYFKITQKKIFLIYFINENNYSEEEDYVSEFIKTEDLDIIYIYGDYVTGMKFLIQKFLLNVIIMGSRKDDFKHPNTEDNLLLPSTGNYPQFLRFMPVYNWDYEDVWRLILSSRTSYLKLYDMGFSSIGRKGKTKVNEALIYDNSRVLPAWCLEDYISERNFRS
jgi:3'-phosphoadenosine 5'-phosphosulfate sulfotransferase (PAPS reductase)/FAD synthetase